MWLLLLTSSPFRFSISSHCANCLLNKSLGQQPRQPGELPYPFSHDRLESFLLLFSLRSLKKRKLAGENCRPDGGWADGYLPPCEGLVALPFGLAKRLRLKDNIATVECCASKIVDCCQQRLAINGIKSYSCVCPARAKKGRG